MKDSAEIRSKLDMDEERVTIPVHEIVALSNWLATSK